MGATWNVSTKTVLGVLVVVLVLTPLCVLNLSPAYASLKVSATTKADVAACSKAVRSASNVTQSEVKSCLNLEIAAPVPCAFGAQGVVFTLDGEVYAVKAGSRPLRLAKASHHEQFNAYKSLCTKPPPGIGAKFTVVNQHNQVESVKLVSVIDPATGQDGLGPKADDRFVGIEIQITNQSKTVDSGDANNNTSVVGSNEQVYSADFAPLSECTDFDSGQYNLSPGEPEIGCVTVQIPNGVGVAKVKYNPSSGFSTNNAEWTLAPPPALIP